MTIFNNLLKRAIPADIVFEDDECLAFRDIHPQAPTHVLLIPKKEIPSTAELRPEDSALMGSLMLKAAQVAAMKSGDKPRLAAVRLILAKLKDRDIELRTATNVPDDDTLVVEVLQKMAKQRRESITLYEQGGRQELAEAEANELAVI